VLGAGRNHRDGAFRITAALREAFSTITLVWADAGYTGRFVRDARKIWDLAVPIVKRPDQAKGFVLLHRRWVVERSFAWLTKFRRLVRDYETPGGAAALRCVPGKQHSRSAPVTGRADRTRR
jgi:transposase